MGSRTWPATLTNWAGSGMEPCKGGEMDIGTDRRAGASEDKDGGAGGRGRRIELI